jgi:hypothetical protein
MKQRTSTVERQHAEDKPIIDHLTNGPLRPTRRQRTHHRFSSEDGRELQEALRKRWTWAKNGGLPD